MTLPSKKGEIKFVKITWKAHFYSVCFVFSQLSEDITGAFRQQDCKQIFINNLEPLADGKTAVPMKTKFGEFTLEVISKV